MMTSKISRRAKLRALALLLAAPSLPGCGDAAEPLAASAPVEAPADAPAEGPEATPTTSAAEAQDSLVLHSFESGSIAPWYTYTGSGTTLAIRAVSPAAVGGYAMQVDYSAKLGGVGGVQREYKTPTDWSGYATFRFHFRGQGTGNVIWLEIRDNGPSAGAAELFQYTIEDDFTGWKQFELPWSAFTRRADWQPSGAPNDGFNRTSVWGYRFIPRSGTGRFAVDQVTLAAPPRPAPDAGPCPSSGYLRRVPVTTAAALREALAAARPGDQIELADGVYAGQFEASRSGTADERITLCGGAGAVLQGSSIQSGYGFRLRASYWTLRGFTVTNSLFGVYLERASHNVLDDLTIHHLGQEGVHFRTFSSHNVLRNSRIRDTGVKVAEYGEGVYVGTYRGQWATYTGGQPDASDHNQVIDNVLGPDVRAEHIDVKEGTTGGLIRGNTFIGAGMVQSKSWVDSWVELKGNGYTVTGNRGLGTIRHGFEVFVELSGWGEGNVFSGNVADLAGAAGYGFKLSAGNTLRCDNTTANAGAGLANVTCQ